MEATSSKTNDLDIIKLLLALLKAYKQEAEVQTGTIGNMNASLVSWEEPL